MKAETRNRMWQLIDQYREARTPGSRLRLVGYINATLSRLEDPNEDTSPDNDDGWNAHTAANYRSQYGKEPPRHLYNPGTPVALDRGEAVAELAKALADFEFESPSDWARDVVKAAAERWAALQFRPGPSHKEKRALVAYENDDGVTVVLGWLPLDALPSEPVKP